MKLNISRNGDGEREGEISGGHGIVLLFTRYNGCVLLLALTWVLEVEQLKVEMDPWLHVVLGVAVPFLVGRSASYH